MSVNRGLFTSTSGEWSTPQEFYDVLDQEFHFTLDPCATAENAKCPKFYTLEGADGLWQSWAGERVFCNPPYGRKIWRWIEKAHAEAEAGALVVCLIPSRTDTRWWHDHCMKASEIRFVKGRLCFGDGTKRAPFPSAVVVFRPAEGVAL